MKILVALALAISLPLGVGCRRKAEGVANGAKRDFTPDIRKAAEELGVALYPGSTPDPSTSPYLVKQEPEGKRFWMLMISADALDKVVNHYQRTLNAKGKQVGGTTQIEGLTSNGSKVTVSVGKESGTGTSYSITGIKAKYAAATTAPQTINSPAIPTGVPQTTQGTPRAQPSHPNAVNIDMEGARPLPPIPSRNPADNPPAGTPPPAPPEPQDVPPPVEEPPPLEEPPPMPDPPADPPPTDLPPGEGP